MCLGNGIFVVGLDACCVNINSLDMWLKKDAGSDEIEWCASRDNLP